jgi:hypothetical protein
MDQPVQARDERNRQLVRIIEQMQEFIEEQLSRWDSVVDSAEETISMHAQASRLLKQARSERANWDREHGERIAKLQAESELLEQAWKRIETEDRRLAAKDAIAANAHNSAASLHTPNRSPAAPQAAESSKEDQDLDATQDRLVAVQEFVKLSVEIANHAKRTR